MDRNTLLIIAATIVIALLVVWSLPATPPTETTATPADHNSGAGAAGHTARADAAGATADATAVAGAFNSML